MPKIHVHTAFNLLLDNKSDRVRFEPGVHDVTEEVAEHWYTQEHASLVGDRAEPEEPAPVADPDQFDAMSDEQLRAFVKDRDGKTPHPRTSREKLLKAARGDEAASAEVEADGPEEPEEPESPVAE